jgi:hypothetical protein
VTVRFIVVVELLLLYFWDCIKLRMGIRLRHVFEPWARPIQPGYSLVKMGKKGEYIHALNYDSPPPLSPPGGGGTAAGGGGDATPALGGPPLGGPPFGGGGSGEFVRLGALSSSLLFFSSSLK